MNNKALVWNAKWGIILAACCITLAAPAAAGPISAGVWQEFSFTDIGVPATGCFPNDPGGNACIPSSGTPTSFLDTPPWTFVSAPGISLIVTDAFLSGDRFEVFDFGVSLGLTSAPTGGVGCGDDPVACFKTTGISKATFTLAPGNHSITITPTISNGGSGFLAARAVPEPGTWTFLGIGIGILALGRAKPVFRPIREAMVRRGHALLAIGGWTTLILFLVNQTPLTVQAQIVNRFLGPTSSQPLALTADDAFLATVNPDNNSVSFFDVRQDRNRLLAEVPVQSEPQGVAILPDGSKAYVANTVSGSVSVLPLNIRNGLIQRPQLHIPVGTEPYGLALTPNGTRLYVSNARSNNVSVINTATDQVIATISNVGLEPRGIAITNDGDGDDTDETVYVTQFLSVNIPGKFDGRDDAKAGLVTVISAATNTVTGTVTINPLNDTGIKANGDALARIAPGANFTFTTGAYPNQFNNIAVKGNFAFIPNVGASPNGPVRFDVNTQSLLSVFNRTTKLDAGSLNMHLAVKGQTNPVKLFNTLPWAMAFKHNSNQAYVVAAASNIVIKLVVDPATGAAAVQSDPADPTRVLQIKVGKNPRGIVVNSADTRAYVMNYVSRNLTVIKLVGNEAVLTTVKSANRPVAGSAEDKIHVGKELFNTSVGEFDSVGGQTIRGRMSSAGWGACSTCHPFGLTDNVVWIFPSGPKRTISLHTDFDQTDPNRQIQRMLNWNAERDEEEDFERNIRAVSGGAGMIVQADGVTPEALANVPDLTPVSNANRIQLKVRGINGWDAIKAYVQFGIRAPISPTSKIDPQVILGRSLFIAANCQQCHGGPQWTSSRVRFTPPPDVAQIVNGQIVSELKNVGTFSGFNPIANSDNEVRQNGAAPLGAQGFAPGSLLSLFAFPGSFLHNGTLPSLSTVLENVQHRSAGTGSDLLTNPADRAALVRFIESIDAATVPIF